jgi:hypothetical protein
MVFKKLNKKPGWLLRFRFRAKNDWNIIACGCIHFTNKIPT